MKKLTFAALALSLIAALGYPPMASAAAVSGYSLERSCHFERQYFTGGYHLYQVCMTDSVVAETIELEVEYIFWGTFYYV